MKINITPLVITAIFYQALIYLGIPGESFFLLLGTIVQAVFIFKKQDALRFPAFMSPEERLKFRKEHRDLLANPDKTQSKFFKRWAPDVQFPKSLEVVNPV